MTYHASHCDRIHRAGPCPAPEKWTCEEHALVGYVSGCDPCQKARDKEYVREWKKANRSRVRIVEKTRLDALRLEAFEAYGGPICKCCGEAGFPFLTIDHINGVTEEEASLIPEGRRGGRGRRMSTIELLGWLKSRGFPPGYRVLCYNCNCARKLGPCPHEGAKTELCGNRSIEFPCVCCGVDVGVPCWHKECEGAPMLF